ncbi:MAG: prepilin-type N-terminal cleavage/methylation domain-containing protein, partial [Candidatus Eremiobacteraeota bacterium]|nr:prepilin-type N-terminal cleavage/methylation domain-containing protein [Candidatus Eremiobacteraeota bacterium]
MGRTMRRGHSLAEVVISIFLLGLVVGAILNLWPTSLLS